MEAIFSDGESAAGRHALLRPVAAGLEIIGAEGETLGVWPWRELTSSRPLEAGMPVNIGCSRLPGARLYIEDSGAAAVILPHAPHLSPKAERRRIFIPIAIMLALLLSAGAALWLSGWSPSKAIARMMPLKMRQAMGEQVISFMTGKAKICHEPAGERAMGRIMARLNAARGKKGGAGRDFEARIADMDMMNAFAVPGGAIIVSGKLIEFVKSPEELAGVIAHEMGHGMELHPEAGLVRAMGMEALLNLFSGGAGGNMGNLGLLMLQLSFSRDAEREADQQAIGILRKAAIPAPPFAAFFRRLRKRHGFDDEEAIAGKTGKDEGGKSGKSGKGDEETLRTLKKSFNLLSTHPPLLERIRMIEKQPQWPARSLLNKDEWRALRSICD
jgi:Zn-dependent protease with chaperone function